MEYRVKVAEDDIHVEVDIQEDRSLKIAMDEKLYDVRYTSISGHWIHIALNNGNHTRRVNAYVSQDPEGKTVVINGRSYLVRDLETQSRRVGKGTAPFIPDQVTPPMPAVVTRILVQAGDRVVKGQDVVVVSAMKMETTLCAPFDGTVTRVNTAVNDKVSPGQVLVEIEKNKA